MIEVHNTDKPKFMGKACKKPHLENVLSYLRFDRPKGRFCKKSKRILGQVIHNLIQHEEVQFRVGQGHTVEATIKNKLEKCDLLIWHPGHHVPNKSVSYSTIKATPLFHAVANRYCQLRIGKDKHIGYWEDTDTLGELIEFNAFARQHEFNYPHGEIDPTQRFNYLRGNQNQAPVRQRLISQVQGIKKHVRPTIKIDGKDTARFDVTATHPQLIINCHYKQAMLFDPYDIAGGHEEGELIRNAAKIALMMMLNTESKKSAVAAFREELRKHDNESTRHAVDRYVKLQSYILDQVYEHNPLLEPFFYRSRYLELMHMDANIVWNCMRILASQGIPSLTVHDEVIVQQEYLQIALDTYKQCWIKETGIEGLGIEPQIKVENRPIDGESKAKLHTSINRLDAPAPHTQAA